MSWLIIILILFLVLMAVIGYIRGFSKMLISLLAMILSIVLTWIFAPKIKTLIVEHTNWDEKLASKIAETMLVPKIEMPEEEETSALTEAEALAQAAAEEEGEAEVIATEEAETEAPAAEKPAVEITREMEDAAMVKMVDDSPIPTSMKDYAKNYMTMRTLEDPTLTKRQALGELLADLIITVLVAVALFIVSMILISLLGKLLDLVNKIPGFKQVNGILGAVFGLVQGVLIMDFAFIVLLLFSSTFAGQYLLGEIGKSSILTWLYEHNFLLYLFQIAKTKLFG